MLCCQARGKEDDHIGVKEDMHRTGVTEVDARDSLRSAHRNPLHIYRDVPQPNR